MKVNIVKIDESASNYIEKLFYEYNASLNILRFLMSQDDVKSENLKMYCDASEEKYTALEIGKKEISEAYKPDGINDYTYTFDFDNQSIIYSWEESENVKQ